MIEIQKARIATIVALVERKPRIGRTALMKLCYFLQTLRGVPLGYRFTLYSYGPFDSSVLSDLSTGEALGALHSEVKFYPNTYGYAIRSSDNSELARGLGAEFLKEHEPDI